jgi:NAD+-dependent secondary alcohol dehydrogenase Adh1
MKAARLYGYDPDLQGPGFVKLEEVEEPRIQDPNEVLLRVGGAGLCRTDLHIIQGLWDDALVVDPPYILGHENAGWIEEVGRGVHHVRPGDAVVVLPGLSDGVCRACRQGNDNLCETLVWQGIQKDGGFADRLVTRERNVIKLPEGMEPKDAAPLPDAGLSAYHAAKKAVRVLAPDATAVVIGVGGLGHVGIQVLRALTPARIVALDRSELALELASDLGADHVVAASDGVVEKVMEMTGGRGAEAVLDFVGEEQTPAQGLQLTATGGYYFVIGYGGKIEVPTMEMIATEKNIIGNIGGTSRELQELIALGGAGKVRLEIKDYALDDINAAIADLRDLKIKGRAVLVP